VAALLGIWCRKTKGTGDLVEAATEPTIRCGLGDLGELLERRRPVLIRDLAMVFVPNASEVLFPAAL
jgi:hypothetical protein